MKAYRLLVLALSSGPGFCWKSKNIGNARSVHVSLDDCFAITVYWTEIPKGERMKSELTDWY